MSQSETLTAAEGALIEATRAGEHCDLSDRSDTDRLINAGVLKRLLINDAQQWGIDRDDHHLSVSVTGAVIVGNLAGFHDSVVRLEAFRECTFKDFVQFDAAIFGRPRSPTVSASSRMSIDDVVGFDVEFDDVDFCGSASFNLATFTRNARFTDACFNQGLQFNQVTVCGDLHLNHVTVKGGQAAFMESVLLGRTWVGGTSEERRSAFADASFNRSLFVGDADFGPATFTDGGSFDEATFLKCASFSETVFSAPASFVTPWRTSGNSTARASRRYIPPTRGSDGLYR